MARLKVKPVDLSDSPAANFVFMVDVSGSMDSNDKLGLLKSCLSTLVDNLRPDDKVAIVTYASNVEKSLESTPSREASKIKKKISKLTAKGSTAGGEAMKMAYEEALENFIEGGNNRHENSKFYSVANDTKVQITFDSLKVDSYRLIGYENRILSQDDFENDGKDAGEIGAGQTITALYEIVPASEFYADQQLAVFDARYKKALGDESLLLTENVHYLTATGPHFRNSLPRHRKFL